jgi:hypothetical protein
MTRRGNCYVASEALYHALGGKRAGWTPCVLRMPDGERHWFLRGHGVVLDPSARQFSPRDRRRIPYTQGRGTGFLTKRPSRRARALLQAMTWQIPTASSLRNLKGRQR